MFTGIIESLGTLHSLTQTGSNTSFWVASPLSDELKIDQSVCHDGVCLTVDQLAPGRHRVTAIAETLSKTNLPSWFPGSQINLERCMTLNGRLDGHIVQGHVDTTATCLQITEKDGSWEYQFGFNESFAHLVIEKGSVAVNGTSLTCFDVARNSFRVAIIPYTYEQTSISQVQAGTLVNIEFDLLGKYVQRWMEVRR